MIPPTLARGLVVFWYTPISLEENDSRTFRPLGGTRRLMPRLRISAARGNLVFQI